MNNVYQNNNKYNNHQTTNEKRQGKQNNLTNRDHWERKTNNINNILSITHATIS